MHEQEVLNINKIAGTTKKKQNTNITPNKRGVDGQIAGWLGPVAAASQTNERKNFSDYYWRYYVTVLESVENVACQPLCKT